MTLLFEGQANCLNAYEWEQTIEMVTAPIDSHSPKICFNRCNYMFEKEGQDESTVLAGESQR